MIKQSELDEYTQLEKYISQEDAAKIKSELVTCPNINSAIFGTISELSKNHAKSVLITTPEMLVDDQGLIHDSFVALAGSYVAQAAINKEFSVMIGAKNFFYAPLKYGDVLELEAQAFFDESSKKREVKVIGRVQEVKVFEAVMQFVITDEHIFKLKRPSNAKSSANSAPTPPPAEEAAQANQTAQA